MLRVEGLGKHAFRAGNTLPGSVGKRLLRASFTATTLSRAASGALWLAAACNDDTVIVGKLPRPSMPDAGRSESGVDAASVGAAGSQPPRDASLAVAPPVPRLDRTPYTVAIETSSYSELCNGSGSVLTSVRADGSASPCEARVERRVFGYGLCACEALQIEGESFLIDSFDSSAGAYTAGETGGNVGLAGTRMTLAHDTQILGSLSIAGDGVLPLAAASLVVSGDLKSNAALQVRGGMQRIVRDLWAGSDVVVSAGSLRVEGDAYQASQHTGLDALSIGGVRHQSELEVPEPCRCDAAAPIAVDALVAQASEQHDNAAASFDPSALAVGSLVTDAHVLPCGRLYGTSLTLDGPSTFVWMAMGRTALFLQGDLRVAESSTLMVGAPLSGELDLFVAGNIEVAASATLSLGASTRPAAMRVFVGGEINAQGSIQLAAQLYAPNATFSTAANTVDLDQFGAIYARSIQLVNDRFHYDRAILHTGPACVASQPVSCASCYECPEELACTAGTCQPCESDSDCCEPTVCTAGKCRPLVSSWP